MGLAVADTMNLREGNIKGYQSAGASEISHVLQTTEMWKSDVKMTIKDFPFGLYSYTR